MAQANRMYREVYNGILRYGVSEIPESLPRTPEQMKCDSRRYFDGKVVITMSMGNALLSRSKSRSQTRVLERARFGTCYGGLNGNYDPVIFLKLASCCGESSIQLWQPS